MIVTLSSHSEIIKSIGRMSRRLFPDCNLVEEDEKYFSSDDCCCQCSLIMWSYQNKRMRSSGYLDPPIIIENTEYFSIFCHALVGRHKRVEPVGWILLTESPLNDCVSVYCGNARKRATCRQSIEISVWNLKWLWFAFCSGLSCEFIQFKPLLPVPADNSSTTGQKLRRKICFV